MKIFAAISTVSLALLFGSSNVAQAASVPASNGLIISLTGDVKIRRYSGYIITPDMGTYLYPGDQLLATNNSKILVQCNVDLSIVSVQGNQQINTCSQAKCTEGLARCSRRGDTVAWNEQPIPYLITPRRSKLLNNRPLIRWQSVPGATSYTLKVRDVKASKVVWETKIEGTEVVYGGEQTLQENTSYRLIVEAEIDSNTTISSTQESERVQSLKLIDGETATKVNLAKENIEQQQWDEITKKLAIANLYLQDELVSEAVLILEDLVKNSSATRAIYRQLGDLYFQKLLLVPQARDYYLRALTLSGDLEETTVIQEELSRVYRSLGEKEEAIKWLNLAKAGYESLGDYEQVEELNQQLKNPQ